MLTDAEVKTEKNRITAQLWRMMDSVDDLAEAVYGTDGPEPGLMQDLADHLSLARHTLSEAVDEIQKGKHDGWLRTKAEAAKAGGR
jgi:hypothetical protein